MSRRPRHIGRPPSVCGLATEQSAWVPADEAHLADCTHCVLRRNNPIGAALTAWRISEGLSQAEAASLMGVCRVAWVHYERGRSCPRLDKVLRLVALRPSARSLFGVDLPPVEPTT